MAYFNFKIAEKAGITPEDIIKLQLIKQHKLDDNTELIEKYITNEILQNYKEKGWTTLIKGSKGDTEIQRTRLSDKGSSLLDTIETPDVLEEDLKILDWIVNIYRTEDKIIGNKKRIASGIANFRVNTSITKNNLARLINTFINDEKEFEWSKKLENLFFNPKNIYQRKFILDDCRLFEYYLKNKDYFDKIFT